MCRKLVSRGIIGFIVLVILVAVAGRGDRSKEASSPTVQPTTEVMTVSATATNIPGYVRKEDYGDEWPFTVDEGVVSCQKGGVVFYSGGTIYAMNGIALGMMKSNSKW